MEDLGVGGDIDVKELGLGASWIVLEDDLISLEKDPGVIRDIWLVGDGLRRYNRQESMSLIPCSFYRTETTHRSMILRWL